MDRPTPAVPSTLAPPTLIDRREQLSRLEQAVSRASHLALDTESNSLYAYTERVCLIQLSMDQADFLIDPLSFDSTDLEFLGRACADPAIEKVFHAAEYDIMVLRRDLGFQFAGIFDTMIAARILGWANIGLAALLSEHFGVEMNKTHQRANWGLRPLAPVLTQYAQLDVHYLLALRDMLKAEIVARGCVEEAQELFAEVCEARWKGGVFDPEGFWNINGARGLPPVGLSVLKELYEFREQQGRSHNLPVFKILSDATLIELAAARPRSRDELAQIRALGASQIRRYGSDILGCVQRGLKARPPQHAHRQNGIDELTTRRFEALHLWRKETAARRGVSSEIILSKDSLWEIAITAPRSAAELETLQSIGPWRRRVYGQDILNVLANLDNEAAAPQA